MLASQKQLYFGLTCPDVTVGLPPIAAAVHKGNVTFVPQLSENGFHTLSRGATKEWCRNNQTSAEEQGVSPERLRVLFWQQFLPDPGQWWDKNPGWVGPDAPSGVAGMSTPSAPVTASAGGPFGSVALHDSAVEIAECRRLCEEGQLTEAVDALSLRVHQELFVPNNLFYVVLKRCLTKKDLVLGRRIHALTIRSGYEGNAFLATHLIGLYASHGRLEEAMRVFTKVSSPDTYNWASIIFAYARHGQPMQAIELYQRMRATAIIPGSRTYVAVLKACASARNLAVGRDVHTHIFSRSAEPDMFVQTCLLDMYAKCGSLDDARKVFDSLAQKDVVTWTAMIAGYAQQGMGQEALALYTSMQQGGMRPPDRVTYVSLLQACANVGIVALQQGKQLHAQLEDRGFQDDVVVGASLVNMYAKCCSLEDARKVFDMLPRKNVVTWTGMITGYIQQGMGQEALSLYSSMQEEGIAPPDSVTFVCLLQACASVGVTALQQGKKLHEQIEERGLQYDISVGGSLVNMYAKCGSVEKAECVFEKLPKKNVVSWNAMIAAFSQQGMAQEALDVYSDMQREGLTAPGSVTFVCLLQACAAVAALPMGKHLHSQIAEQGLQSDVVVGSSLVYMYAKCGSMAESKQVFDSLPKRDIVAWNALIAGFTSQGDSGIVFDLLHRMRQEGVQPQGITFVSVLTVCSHVGLVDEGRHYFQVMTTDYGISPTIEHYTCMMDLLGRAGNLDEALQLVNSMPFQPDGAVWRTLLAACRKWGNVQVGKQAFESALRLDEQDASAYILMSKIYEGAHMWKEAKEMHATRMKLGASKQQGQSWTDTGGVLHSFVVRE